MTAGGGLTARPVGRRAGHSSKGPRGRGLGLEVSMGQACLCSLGSQGQGLRWVPGHLQQPAPTPTAGKAPGWVGCGPTFKKGSLLGGTRVWTEFSLEVNWLVGSPCRGSNSAGSRAWKGLRVGFLEAVSPVTPSRRPQASLTQQAAVLKGTPGRFSTIMLVHLGASLPRFGSVLFCNIKR